MKPRPISDYIVYGTELRYLRDASAGWKVAGEDFVIDNIERFLGKTEKFNLHVTLRASHKLVDFLKALREKPANDLLSIDEAKELSGIMTDITNVLYAESVGHHAYIVTDKRIDIKKLLGKVEELFPDKVFSSLPAIAQEDFREAGMCIAFDRSTAAAFHVLRGTEAVLRHFYRSVVRRGAKEKMWGPIIEALKKRRKGPDATLLNLLDNIRNSFRNPTQHPEKIYDIHGSQDLFSLCIDVVSRMVKSAFWKNCASEPSA